MFKESINNFKDVENIPMTERMLMNKSLITNKDENSKLEKLKNLNFTKKNENKEIELDYDNYILETNEDNSDQFLINRKRKIEDFTIKEQLDNNLGGLNNFFVYDTEQKNDRKSFDEEKINYDYVKLIIMP